MTARRVFSFTIAALLLLGIAEVGEGQSLPVRTLAPSRAKTPGLADIPATHRPPPGLCRIWLDNVPPAQQPAPTDCASAIRNRPSNGRVIYPEETPRAKRDEKPSDRGDAKGDGKEDGKGEKKGKPKKPAESPE